ncbi:MAG: PPOX class F420-dependent oxidoreductase [Acidimicrobiales bacterium]
MALTVDQAIAFAADHRQGVLVTLRRDGRPQLSNVLYGLGPGRSARISVTDGRAKTANLRRDPRASLHVTRDDFFAYVVLEGDAVLSPVARNVDDPVVDELVELYRSLVGEHPDWNEYRRSMVAEGRLVVSLLADRAYGMLGA